MTITARRERDREARRTSILDAVELLLASKPFNDITMEDVAHAAGMAKGTLYLYFKGKEDLALGMALRNQSALLTRFAKAGVDAADGADLLRRLGDAYLDFFATRTAHARAMLRSWLADEPSFGETTEGYRQHLAHKQRFFHSLVAAVDRGKADGSIRPNVDSEQVAFAFWGLLLGTLLLSLRNKPMRREIAVRVDPRRAGERALHTLICGIDGRVVPTEQSA